MAERHVAVGAVPKRAQGFTPNREIPAGADIVLFGTSGVARFIRDGQPVEVVVELRDGMIYNTGRLVGEPASS